MDLLTPYEVADHFGVSRQCIYKACREGRLPCIRVGKSIRIRAEDVATFVTRPYRRRAA